MDVRERAVYYLNIKPRTKAQLTDYLIEKGFPDGEVTAAVKELQEYHYIDDVRYSRLYFEMGFEKGRGINRIRRELKEKGVSEDDIDEAFDTLENIPDQFETAKRIGQAVIEGIDTGELEYGEKQKLQAKIGRRLASRGFSQDIVYKVMRELVK